jgi:hypothetical protein
VNEEETLKRKTEINLNVIEHRKKENKFKKKRKEEERHETVRHVKRRKE